MSSLKEKNTSYLSGESRSVDGTWSEFDELNEET